jgi:hypothetical protein
MKIFLPSFHAVDILGKAMQDVRGGWWTEYHQISYRDVKLELVCYESSAATSTAPECEDEIPYPPPFSLFIAPNPSIHIVYLIHLPLEYTFLQGRLT